eukprot:g34240.t1
MSHLEVRSQGNERKRLLDEEQQCAGEDLSETILDRSKRRVVLLVASLLVLSAFTIGLAVKDVWRGEVGRDSNGRMQDSKWDDGFHVQRKGQLKGKGENEQGKGTGENVEGGGKQGKGQKGTGENVEGTGKQEGKGQKGKGENVEGTGKQGKGQKGKEENQGKGENAEGTVSLTLETYFTGSSPVSTLVVEGDIRALFFRTFPEKKYEVMVTTKDTADTVVYTVKISSGKSGKELSTFLSETLLKRQLDNVWALMVKSVKCKGSACQETSKLLVPSPGHPPSLAYGTYGARSPQTSLTSILSNMMAFLMDGWYLLPLDGKISYDTAIYISPPPANLRHDALANVNAKADIIDIVVKTAVYLSIIEITPGATPRVFRFKAVGDYSGSICTRDKVGEYTMTEVEPDIFKLESVNEQCSLRAMVMEGLFLAAPNQGLVNATPSPCVNPDCPAVFPYGCSAKWGGSACFNASEWQTPCEGPAFSWCALKCAPPSLSVQIPSAGTWHGYNTNPNLVRPPVDILPITPVTYPGSGGSQRLSQLNGPTATHQLPDSLDSTLTCRSIGTQGPAGLHTNGAVLSIDIYDLSDNTQTPGVPFHRDDERFMKHDDIVNLTLGASTATVTVVSYGDMYVPQSYYRKVNLNHGTLHTFNRYQLRKVDFTPITKASHEESSDRISLSFREFITWADIAEPSRAIIASDKYLQNSLRF